MSNIDFDNLRKFLCFTLIYTGTYEVTRTLSIGQCPRGLKKDNVSVAKDIFELLSDPDYEYMQDVILSCAEEDSDIGFVHDTNSVRCIYPMVYDQDRLPTIILICKICNITVGARCNKGKYPEIVFMWEREAVAV